MQLCAFYHYFFTIIFQFYQNAILFLKIICNKIIQSDHRKIFIKEMQETDIHSYTLQNNQTIYYRDVNPQSPKQVAIVLLHGNYSDMTWWTEVVEEIRAYGYRIIVPDMRGFGRSTYNAQCGHFADWARDIIQLIQHLNIKKVVLNGLSFGGGISMKIADLASELVDKLLLICSVSHEGFGTKDQSGFAPKTKQEILKIPRVAFAIKIMEDKNKQAMRQIYDMLLFQKMDHVSEQRKNQLVESPFNQRCYPQLLTALANSDINVENIKAKTLMIHGNSDLVITVASIMGTAEKLGKLEVWQNHTHMIPFEDTPKYSKRMMEFITSE